MHAPGPGHRAPGGAVSAAAAWRPGGAGRGRAGRVGAERGRAGLSWCTGQGQPRGSGSWMSKEVVPEKKGVSRCGPCGSCKWPAVVPCGAGRGGEGWCGATRCTLHTLLCSARIRLHGGSGSVSLEISQRQYGSIGTPAQASTGQPRAAQGSCRALS